MATVVSNERSGSRTRARVRTTTGLVKSTTPPPAFVVVIFEPRPAGRVWKSSHSEACNEVEAIASAVARHWGPSAFLVWDDVGTTENYQRQGQIRRSLDSTGSSTCVVRRVRVEIHTGQDTQSSVA